MRTMKYASYRHQRVLALNPLLPDLLVSLIPAEVLGSICDARVV